MGLVGAVLGEGCFFAASDQPRGDVLRRGNETLVSGRHRFPACERSWSQGSDEYGA